MNDITSAVSAAKNFPSMPLESWKETKDTLHLYLQVVGKIKLGLCPRQNHWWHAALYVSPNGITTRTIPYDNMRSFEIEFDFIVHELFIRTSEGKVRTIKLFDGLSVSEFYKQLFACLSSLGVDIKIWGVPYGINITVPFKKDTVHASYKEEAVAKFKNALTGINTIFEEFRGGYYGKSTPVHLFWHSFDLALTRFSGRPAKLWDGAGKVDSEAYSHEVISFGFWGGDDNIPFPAFYSYTYPQPDRLTEEPLEPETAYWGTNRGSALALLPYEEVVKSASPKNDILAFLESTFKAGSKLVHGFH
jgi:hypothetical protein